MISAQPLMLVVETRLRWFPIVAGRGKEFALEKALNEAGCLAFCPIAIREKRASGHAKRIESRSVHPQTPPYIYVGSFAGFPWAIIENHPQIDEMVRAVIGYIQPTEHGDVVVPTPITSDEMTRVMEEGYILPLSKGRKIISTRRQRKSKRIRRMLEAA